jgi:hypothetical protein
MAKASADDLFIFMQNDCLDLDLERLYELHEQHNAKPYVYAYINTGLDDPYYRLRGSQVESSMLLLHNWKLLLKNYDLIKAIFASTGYKVQSNFIESDFFKSTVITTKELVKNIESGILTTYSLNGWAWSSIISLSFALFFFIVFLMDTTFKKLFFWLGAIHVLIFIGSLIIGFIALNEVTNKNNAIILSTEVSVVNEPTEGAKEQFKLHEGTKVTVLECNTKWTAIQLENGNEGWLQTNHLGLF